MRLAGTLAASIYAHPALKTFSCSSSSQLCAVLKENSMPKLPLVEAIAVAKVKAVEESIDMCHK
jgi:hypothetical protein